MNFCDAISKFKKFKRPSWPYGQYIQNHENCFFMYFLPQSSDGTTDNNKHRCNYITTIPIDDVLALDWQEYKETYTFLEAARKFKKITKKSWKGRKRFFEIRESGRILSSPKFDSLLNDEMACSDWIEYEAEI